MENPTCPIGPGIKWLHVPAKAGYKVTIYFILSRSLSEAPFQKRLERDRDQLRPYPRISCDPTHARDQLRPYPQEFYGRSTFFTFIKGQLWPYLTSVSRILQVFALFRRYSGSSTTFLWSNFTTHLGNPCFATLPDNIPFIKFSSPLGNPCFQWFKFKYNIPFINFFSPPLATHALRPYLTTFLLSHFSPPPWATHALRPYLTTFLLSNFPPPLATHALRPYLTTFLLSNFPLLGNPCFQWFKFKYNIPFIKFLFCTVSRLFRFKYNIPFIKFSSHWQPMLCDPTWQHSFYQIFLPPWQPMLSMIQVQVQHSFYQIFSPPLGNPCFATLPDNIPFIKFFSPPWQPMLCDPTWQHSFYQIFPPPANPCFQWFIPPPPWQPMLCDPAWQHSFYQIFPLPLGNLQWFQVQVQHSFYQIFPPPLATHALRPYLTTFLLSNLPPLGNPCFQWFKFKYNIPFITFFPPPPPCQPMLCDPTWQHSFYQNFPPPLATHAFNDSSSSTTFLLSNFSPPPLGNPCFATLPDNIPFIKFPPPPWQPMLSMIKVQVQHSFLSNFFPPLATHALRPYLTTFLLSNFPPPPWQPSMIQVQVQHSFYQIFLPSPWQPMLCDPTWQHSFYQIFPSLATHAFNGSSSSTTFLLSNFSLLHCFEVIQVQVQHSFYQIFLPPLATHALRPYLTTFLLSNFPPLGNPWFQWFQFKYNIPFIKFFPPPLATHALRPYLTTFLLSNFPPLGNPCFQWFKFKYNIPFITFFPPPWQPVLCDPTCQHSFYQIFPPPPLATHALRPYLTTFLLSNFPPLGNPCFQWFKFKYNIPFITFFPPPLATHALRPYLPTFLLSKFPPPPWANHALRPYLTTFLFYQIFPPPLATHALRPYLTTFLFIKFSPPWQPMLSMIQIQVQHSFYQIFPPPLGNPCFATLPDNIPFIKFFPPPLATHAFNDSSSSTTFLLSNFLPPPGQTMLYDPTWQHSFLSNLPPLATHAFNDSSSSTTFLLSNFSPPPLGNPCFATLPDNIPFIKFSPPPLATHAFNDQSSSTTFLFIKFFPPPWQPMLCDPTWQHSFYQIFPLPLGNLQWFKFKYNIPFIKFSSPPLGNPCFATLPDNIPFIKFSPPWQPMLSMVQVQVQHSFYQIFPFCTVSRLFRFKYNIPFIKFFPPPWQPMLCDPTWQHSFYQIFPPLATHAFNGSNSNTTFLLSHFSPPPWQPVLCDPTCQHSFYQIFPPALATHALRPYLTTFLLSNFPPPLATHALRPYLTTFLLSKFPPPPGQTMLCDPTWQHSFFIKFSPTPWANHALRPYLTTFLFIKFPRLGNPCFQWFKFKYNIPFIKIFPPPPLATHALRPYLTTFLWSNFPPPLGNPWFQWFKFKYNIPFINFSPPPLGNPCFATLPDNIPFIKFSPPPWQPMLCDPTWQHSFYQIFSPPLATHAFNDSSSSTTFLLSNFSPSPPWQPMLCDPTWQHSFYQIFLHPLGKPCFATLPDNIPFIKFFPPLATHALNDSSSSTTFLLSIFPPPLATHAFNDSGFYGFTPVWYTLLELHSIEIHNQIASCPGPWIKQYGKVMGLTCARTQRDLNCDNAKTALTWVAIWRFRDTSKIYLCKLLGTTDQKRMANNEIR